MNIDTILDVANAHKIRATYSAVGEPNGAHPKQVGQFLDYRRLRVSWVVSKATGMPTVYLDVNCQIWQRSNPTLDYIGIASD